MSDYFEDIIIEYWKIIFTSHLILRGDPDIIFLNRFLVAESNPNLLRASLMLNRLCYATFCYSHWKNILVNNVIHMVIHMVSVHFSLKYVYIVYAWNLNLHVISLKDHAMTVH